MRSIDDPAVLIAPTSRLSEVAGISAAGDVCDSMPGRAFPRKFDPKIWKILSPKALRFPRKPCSLSIGVNRNARFPKRRD